MFTPRILLRDRPRAFLDIETTGLYPTEGAEIIEIAILKDDHPPFQTLVNPEHIETAEPKALEINGYSPGEWVSRGAISLSEALERVRPLLADSVVIGQNISFDTGFLEAGYRSLGDKTWHIHHKIDTATLAYEHLVPLGLQSLSLRAICDFLDIPPEPKRHRALDGAETCRLVYEALVRASWLQRQKWKWKNKIRGV